MKSSYKNALLVLAVFIVSICASFYPIHQKGYALWGDDLNLIEARNAAQGGTYAYENQNGVFLSSAHTAQSVKTAIPNSLTPILYRYIFQWFGTNPQVPIEISVIMFALFNAFVCALGIKLFSPEVGFAGGLVSALMPEMLLESISRGGYEFALIFLACALFSYFYSSEKMFSPSKKRLVFTSMFFALAALARNAMAISFVPFILYDFWLHRNIKRSAIFLAPFAIIFGLTLTSYSWLPLSNGYTATTNQPFQQVGHFFNDPYTYHFNADETVQVALAHPETIDRTSAYFLSHWNYHVPLKQNIKAYIDAGIFYIQTVVDLIQTGGLIVLFLVLLGAFHLWRTHRKFVEFSVLWIVVWGIGLVLAQTGNNNHLVEISILLSLFTAVGFVELGKNLSYKKTWYVIGLLAVLGNLAAADKWRLYDSYRSSKAGLVEAIVTQVPVADVPGVIAIGIHPDAAYEFAYLTNHDTIYFNPATIQELYDQKKLKAVFAQYHVSGAIGFSTDLSNDIIQQAGVPAISVSSN